jgi:hypothetical protein
MGNEVVDKIIRYENDEMSEEETISFFQELIDSGLCWKLQGHYGRVATTFIEEGVCNAS